MCAPTPPPAPNYGAAAQQQYDANIAAATKTSQLNNPNVISPYGTTSYYTTSPDPTAARTTLEKQIADLRAQMPVWESSDWRAANGLLSGPYASERAAQWFTNKQNELNAKLTPLQRQLEELNRTGLVPMDPDRPTIVQKFSPEQQALYDRNIETKKLLGDVSIQGAKALQGVVGTDLDLNTLPAAPGSADVTRNRAMDAIMARVNEDTDRTKDDVHSNLIAAGIRPGTKAYDDRMALIERGRTDARNQAFLASGQEMTRDFQTDTQRRKDALAEVLLRRQTPLNEVNATLSGSQVTNPFAMPGYAANATVGAAPLFGAQQLASDYMSDLYNREAAMQGNLMGGLFGLGGAGLLAAGAAGGVPALFGLGAAAQKAGAATGGR